MANCNNCHLIIGLSISLIVMAAAAPPASALDETPAQAGAESATIVKAWKARAEKARAYSFKWSEELTMMKGALGYAESDSSSAAKGSPIPPTDLVLPARGMILIDGTRGRFEESRQQWSEQKQQVLKQSQIRVSRDGERRQLFPESQIPYPVGTIAKKALLADLFSIDSALPIALCYRILDDEFKVFDTRGMKVRDVSFPEKGSAIVVATFAHGGGHVELWLDPAREFIPLRYIVVNDTGRTTYDLQIKYKPDDDQDFVPANWTSTLISPNGSIRMVRRIDVKAFEFNQPSNEAEFDLGVTRTSLCRRAPI